MSIATCPKCGNDAVSWIRDDADYAHYICLECKQEFCYPSKTLFECITESMEVLAVEFVEPYTTWGADGYLNKRWRTNFRDLSGRLFDTREEAIAATVAKLKEVEK